TSLEVAVDVFSEETLTGRRRHTSRAYLTFVAIARDGGRVRVPPLIVETDEERRLCEEAKARRARRLQREQQATTSGPSRTLPTGNPLRRDLLQSEHAAVQIDPDAIFAQELMPDDASELEAKQRAGCIEIQHYDRKIVESDRVEGQIDAGE